MRLPRGGPFGTVPADTHEHAKLVLFARSRRRRYRDVHGRAHAPADCQSYRTLGSCLLIRCWDAIRGVTFLVNQGPRPPDDAPPGRGVLPPELLVEMRAPAARMLGADIWGLGMQLGSLFCRVEVVNSRPGLPPIGSTGIQAPSTAWRSLIA